MDVAELPRVRVGSRVLVGSGSSVVPGLAELVLAAGEDDGLGSGVPAVEVDVDVGSWNWLTLATSATPSEKGLPTSPAAPKPTPTAMTANAAHSVTRAIRLSMAAIVGEPGLTSP